MTTIAVLGTGTVGRALAARLAELGHTITIGTRDEAATLARREPDAMGNPPFSAWTAENPDMPLANYRSAIAGSELIVNATAGAASLSALAAAEPDDLHGKILLDISNPLDFSSGFPPSLFVKDTDSLAEQLQAAFPELRIVKTLNTLSAPLMVHPQALAGGDHTVFVAGNDRDAKAVVVSLLESFGHRDILDLGELSAARGTEMYLPLWLRMMGTLGTSMFNIKVVR